MKKRDKIITAIFGFFFIFLITFFLFGLQISTVQISMAVMLFVIGGLMIFLLKVRKISPVTGGKERDAFEIFEFVQKKWREKRNEELMFKGSIILPGYHYGDESNTLFWACLIRKRDNAEKIVARIKDNPLKVVSIGDSATASQRENPFDGFSPYQMTPIPMKIWERPMVEEEKPGGVNVYFGTGAEEEKRRRRGLGRG